MVRPPSSEASIVPDVESERCSDDGDGRAEDSEGGVEESPASSAGVELVHGDLDEVDLARTDVNVPFVRSEAFAGDGDPVASVGESNPSQGAIVDGDFGSAARDSEIVGSALGSEAGEPVAIQRRATPNANQSAEGA